MNKKQIYISLFWSIFFLLIIYVSWIIAALSTTISLFFYYIFFFVIYSLWRKFRKKEQKSMKEFGKVFLYRIANIILIVSIIIFSFAYYHNSISPANMPLHTVSNWKKTVIFQNMSHIWTHEFYEAVKKNIKKAKENDYVLYFEGVKPGTTEGVEKFNTAIWIQFWPELYPNLSKLYDVTFQDNLSLLWIVNDKDYNIDLSIDEIIEIYEEKKSLSPPSERSQIDVPIDASQEIINYLSDLNERELKILVFLNRWIINFMIKSDATQDFLTWNFWNKELFDVILEWRNKILTDKIIHSEHNKIIVTYGLMHFDGVMEILQQDDPKWKITKTENLYPIY